MQASSHKKVNTTIAIDVIAALYQTHLLQTIIVSIGLIWFSSFPDRIERLNLNHRGISHSLLLYSLLGFILICCLDIPGMRWGCYLGLGAVCGSICHILADMCSKTGVTTLGLPIRLNLYSTGNKSEKIFLWTFISINFIVLYLL